MVQNYVRNFKQCGIVTVKNVTEFDEISMIIINSTVCLFIIVTALIILVNVALIYALYKTNRPLSIINKLFIYLSAIDILSVIALILATITSYFTILPCPSIYAFNLLATAFLHIGLVTFDTISILRYLSIKRPFNQSISNLRMCLVISLELFSVAVYIFLLLLVNSNMMKIFTMGIFFTSTTIIVFVNVQSYRIILNQIPTAGMVNSMEFATKSSSSTNINGCSACEVNITMFRTLRRKRSAAIILIIITVSYFFLNLPFLVYVIMEFKISFDQIMFEIFSRLLCLCNTGVNALVYILRRKEIRTFLWKRFKRKH